jgi:exodeoxyribonuclease-5
VDFSEDQAITLEKVAIWRREASPVRHCRELACSPGSRVGPDGRKVGLPHTHGKAQDYPVFSLAGLAGTGKTYLAGRLAEELGIQITYGTPTNKSAHVLRKKLGGRAAEMVRTYFSIMYFPHEEFHCLTSGREVNKRRCECVREGRGDDECYCPQKFTPCGMCPPDKCKVDGTLKFKLRESLGGYRDIVLIDEASMISEERVNEIRSFGVPVLLVGDHGQLPPIKEKMNPWMLNPNVVLTVNHRQAEANGIVDAALRVRATGEISHGSYGDGSTVCVSAKENPSIFEIMKPDRLAPGPDSAIIVPRNSLRSNINKQIHSEMIVSDEDRKRNESRVGRGLMELPCVGDRVISLQNHYPNEKTKREDYFGTLAVRRFNNGWRMFGDILVWNGMTGTVRDVNPHGETFKNPKHRVELIIELDDEDDPESDTGKLHIQVRADIRQFGAESKMRVDQYARVKGEITQLWDYAYALTAHKAQGSEFSRVVVLDAGPYERKRWMYTAMTRAKDQLVVIDWR